MNRPERGAFSIVEALVATAMLGIAGSALVVALGVAGSIRARGAADSGAAAATADRIALLARRPCASADTSATERRGALTDRWAARHDAAGWAFAETVSAAGATTPGTAAGVVTCGR